MNRGDLKVSYLNIVTPYVTKKNERNKTIYKFRCECGQFIYKEKTEVRNLKVRSCGCKKGLLRRKGKPLKKSHELFQTWHTMKKRCYTKTSKAYKYYGGRGIKICDRWLNSFDSFCEDMGKKPSNKHSIDRIDVNGNYCKDNCRWATPKEQANNKRNSTPIDKDGNVYEIEDKNE